MNTIRTKTEAFSSNLKRATMAIRRFGKAARRAKVVIERGNHDRCRR